MSVTSHRPNHRPALGPSLRGSEASTSASRRPGGGVPGRSRSIRSAALSLPSDFPTRSDSQMSEIVERQTWRKSIASAPGSHALTSARWEHSPTRVDLDSEESAAGCSTRQSGSSTKYNPGGWCLRMSRPCSIQTIAKTCRQSSGPLPTAGMWDTGECLTLSISESPRNAVACSSSAAVENFPPLTSWLTPRQWNQYLARLVRSNSHGARYHRLPIRLSRARGWEPASLPWVVSFSSLTRTDGIRWLSGPDFLRYGGFPPDWIPTRSVAELVLETRWSRLWPSGLVDYSGMRCEV
jgi:hypothetical protein